MNCEDQITISVASQLEAEAGAINNKTMTPLRVKQAIDTLGISQEALASNGGAMVGLASGRAVENKIDEIKSVLDFAGDSFADKLEAACNAGGLVRIPPGFYSYNEEKTITGVSNLSIINDGQVTASEDLIFDTCHNLRWEGRGAWLGNSVPKATINDLPSENVIELDDVTGFAVGDDIISFGVEDDDGNDMPWYACRGVISDITGTTITVIPDTTLGGAWSLLTVGHRVANVISTSKAIRGEVRINSSDKPYVRGYFERDLYIWSCTAIDIDVQSRYGYPSVIYCVGGKINFNTTEGRFYGAGVFKSRGIAVTGWFDTAYFGGFVAKNNYGGSYLISGRRGLGYGVQLRDDTGSAGSLPGLPPRITDTRQQGIIGLNLSECGCGLLFDNSTIGAACGPILIERGSGTRASVLFASSSKYIVVPSLIIRDHGQCLTQIGTYSSNTDVYFQLCSDIDVTAKIVGSKHATAINSFGTGTGDAKRVRLDLTLHECSAGARVHGGAQDVDIGVTGCDPSVVSLILCTITGNVSNTHVRRARPIAGVNSWGVAVAVDNGGTSMGMVTIEGVTTRPGDVSFADIRIDPNNTSGTVRVTAANDLRSNATYGITTRRCNNVYVEGPINTGHATANHHFFSFTATAYRIYGAEQRAFLSVPFSTSMQEMNTEQAQDVACTGWTSNSVVLSANLRGSTLAGTLRVSHKAAGNVTVGLFNPTTGNVTVPNPMEVTLIFRDEFKPT